MRVQPEAPERVVDKQGFRVSEYHNQGFSVTELGFQGLQTTLSSFNTASSPLRKHMCRCMGRRFRTLPSLVLTTP